jgi:hypothetical protein
VHHRERRRRYIGRWVYWPAGCDVDPSTETRRPGRVAPLGSSTDKHLACPALACICLLLGWSANTMSVSQGPWMPKFCHLGSGLRWRVSRGGMESSQPEGASRAVRRAGGDWGPSSRRSVSSRRPATDSWRTMRMRLREGSPWCAGWDTLPVHRGRALVLPAASGYGRVAGSGPAFVGPRSAFVIGFIAWA